MTKTLLAAMLKSCVSVTCASFVCAASLQAQECRGDFNEDGRVSIDELVTAVNSALKGCDAAQRQGCLDSGGSVSSGECCTTVPEFPDTCDIGSCGCAPQFSRDVALCDCGDSRCFSRNENACVTR